MSNELTAKQADLVSLVGGNSLGEVIKPLKTEIHLFNTYVAGTTHIKDQSVMDTIREGDHLILQRENNKYDSNAILILTEGGKKKIGYVPEKDNIVFARLMDAGKYLIAKINSIERKGAYTKISIGIFLVDF
ncbi:MAG: HIRAN domain-containing protein [Lentihominibacter sp.]